LATDWTTEGIRGYIPDRGKRFISSPKLPDRLRGSLATDWTTQGIHGYIPDRGKRFIFSPKLPDRLRGSISLQWLPVSDFKGVKRPWHEADHSHVVPGTNGAKPSSSVWLCGVQGNSLLDFASFEAVKYQRNSWH
jgi:hypothetical protein